MKNKLAHLETILLRYAHILLNSCFQKFICEFSFIVLVFSLNYNFNESFNQEFTYLIIRYNNYESEIHIYESHMGCFSIATIHYTYMMESSYFPRFFTYAKTLIIINPSIFIKEIISDFKNIFNNLRFSVKNVLTLINSCKFTQYI